MFKDGLEIHLIKVYVAKFKHTIGFHGQVAIDCSICVCL